MSNDLGARRRGTTASKGKNWGILVWKFGVPLLLGLALLALYLQQRPTPSDATHSASATGQATLQQINCTTSTPNITCNCPPAAGNVSDPADSDGVQRLANKVSTRTVDKIVDAASSTNPTDQTVRVNSSFSYRFVRSPDFFMINSPKDVSFIPSC